MRSRNHSRSCAKLSGSARLRSTATTGGSCGSPARRSDSTRSASSPTVGPSNSWRSGSSTPNTARTRETTRVASSECPPSAKKSSFRPTRSTRSSSAQIPASTSSAGVRGATYPSAEVDAAAASGAGRALRSTLPLGVSGSASIATMAPGTMWSGSDRRRCARSSSASTEPTTYATTRRSPASSPRTITAQSATSAWRRSTDSISPSSMRKPRTFTCSSRRPRYSTVPLARQRARSPVRYSRAPGREPNGSGTKRSAVSAARFR
ncbi:MAG TPA: hypothetical protein VFY65_20335 [Longimicrobium sp.]|nr:hypothetical protein [Longimicrobium sp.]